MNRARYISKSKFLHGLQCPKLLWCDYHAKHLFPEVEASLQAIFDQGHEVGALAKKMFPNGIEVDSDPADFDGAVQLTRKLLPLRQPIFEATFSAGGGYARADILNPVGRDEWDIIEVKSTTDLKDVHIPDLAFQAWLFTEAGIKIRRCCLCHINREFVRQSEIDPRQFFTLCDVTAQVSEQSRGMEEQVGQMAKVIQSAKCPDIQIGRQCDDPYPCLLHDHCWSFLPPQNVLDLYDDKKGRGWDLLKCGTLRLADIPAKYNLSAKQAIQRATAISGQPQIHRTQIEAFLNGLKYPLHFLDFETFMTAIPMFDGIRPYEQIPFQFSLHVVRRPEAKPEQRKFLAGGRNDPREEFMRQLRAAIEPSGSVVVYNAVFEKGRLRDCAEFLPEYQGWVAELNGRIVDLLLPFRAFHYYHPDQSGSASIKSVLPALTGKGYEGLEIQEGDTASREFLRVTFGEVSEAERQRVREALDRYCGQDTEGMIWILDALKALTKRLKSHLHNQRRTSQLRLGKIQE